MECDFILFNKYGDINLSFKVGGVRLGEHNILTDPDCEQEYCAEPVQDFLPESIIVHKNYNKPEFKNDIAIIRLNKPVIYNGELVCKLINLH